MSTIKINDLTKAFNDLLVLDHVNLTIENASIVGLAGPSGSGKSTLLRLIQGLEIADSGSITGKTRTGFMFQDFQLFPHMTVLENVTYAPKLKKTIDDVIQKAIVLLEKLDISSKAQEYPANLSGGQKQRVALARSLMMESDILLCDEPTSGLDVATTSDIVALLKPIKDMGMTMIIASHDLDFLVNIADRIVVLKQGKIVADIVPHHFDNPINYLKTFY